MAAHRLVDPRLGAPARIAGALMIATGLAVLLGAFARFVREGIGTPAPVAPTERLVVGGAYRSQDDVGMFPRC